jgi:hypothetical protein
MWTVQNISQGRGHGHTTAHPSSGAPCGRKTCLGTRRMPAICLRYKSRIYRAIPFLNCGCVLSVSGREVFFFFLLSWWPLVGYQSKQTYLEERGGGESEDVAALENAPVTFGGFLRLWNSLCRALTVTIVRKFILSIQLFSTSWITSERVPVDSFHYLLNNCNLADNRWWFRLPDELAMLMLFPEMPWHVKTRPTRVLSNNGTQRMPCSKFICQRFWLADYVVWIPADSGDKPRTQLYTTVLRLCWKGMETPAGVNSPIVKNLLPGAARPRLVQQSGPIRISPTPYPKISAYNSSLLGIWAEKWCKNGPGQTLNPLQWERWEARQVIL